MICHEFKGGIGTASRVLREAAGGCTVGVLVQANYGERAGCGIDGVRVGEAIPASEVPSPWDEEERRGASPPAPARARSSWSSRPTRRCCPTNASGSRNEPASGSLASAAPAAHTSGDLFIAFSTGNALPDGTGEVDRSRSRPMTSASSATSIVDALFDAADRGDRGGDRQRPRRRETMIGRDGITAHALPHDRLWR